MPLSRRAFLERSALLAGAGLLPGRPDASPSSMPITIAHVDADFEREPLLRPFGFKGGYLTEIWQAVSHMRSAQGTSAEGLGTQSVLWSDARVFREHTESGGNALMYALTEYALQRARGRTFTDPIALLDELLPDVYAYGQRITGHADLRKTFALNALVGVDNAAWLLYARENGLDTFDAMVPPVYRPGVGYRHRSVASVPTFAFTVPPDDMVDFVERGHFFLKIKLGHPGTQEEMLAADMAHVEAIHRALGDRRTDRTETGKLPYYFDLNGRYESKATLLRLLDHARRIGAFDQIVVLEEPFPEPYLVDVSDVGVLVAADESAHTDADALTRIELGYGAIALKAAAKTLSMTLKIAQLAHERQIPCFVADLTVNPILVEWNKNVAARLAPMPGFTVGLMEVNGHQNYRDWDRMLSYHPMPQAPWVTPVDGAFRLGPRYWTESGGILASSPHYAALFDRPSGP